MLLLASLLACTPAHKPPPANVSAAPEAPGDVKIGTRKAIYVGDRKPELMLNGIRYYVLREGDGPSPTAGKIVQVHYSGFMTDGTRIDSSVERGHPLTFTVGAGEVIPGWDETVQKMKVGEIRQIHVPPAMGYGEDGGGVMPPGTTLIFDMELVAILN